MASYSNNEGRDMSAYAQADLGLDYSLKQFMVVVNILRNICITMW